MPTNQNRRIDSWGKCMNDITYWDWDSSTEILYFDSIDDAVNDLSQQTDLKEGDVVTIFGYKRSTPKVHWKTKYVEDLIESLDEEYGSEVHMTEITEEMKQISEEFVDRILSLYVAQACEKSCEENVVITKVGDFGVEWCLQSDR